MVAEEGTIVFTGGGTGGHIYPGLAVIEALRKDYKGRIVWIGSKKDSDRRTVEAAGVEYIAVPSGKLRRSFSLENLADAFRVIAGYAASKRALKRLRPVLLFSKGGYVSVPPCRAAARLGIPVFTHECDLTPGLATRLNARRAERVLVSYDETLAHLSPELAAKAVVTGNPIRAAIRAGDAAKGRALLGADSGEAKALPIVLFIGGSQGARQVNELAEGILPELCKLAIVVHQTGEGAAGAEASILSSVLPEGRYHRFAYIRDELPHILAAADLVVGRSGAGMVWEAGALGKPMVLIPLAGSGTRGDQVDNARLFEAAGAATVLVGPDAAPERLLSAIGRYLDSQEERRRAGEAASRLAGRDASAAAAKLIIERIRGKP
jgi:UDP-N-acetylglucosamine--N-acetylmuramyl-(pentapeptide) pyrophosphoryl-undecaprenol N-acetylglucosamine transferase